MAELAYDPHLQLHHPPQTQTMHPQYAPSFAHPPPHQQQLAQPPKGRSAVGGHTKLVGGQANPPSKVLHIRGLPAYTSEADLVHLFSAVAGVVPTRILILPNSNQAFIQLSNVDAAAVLLQQQEVQGGSFVIKGNKSIILQYSNRQEIHTPNTQQPQQLQQQQQSAASSSSHPSQQSQQGPMGQQHPQSMAASSSSHESSQVANSILLVTVLNTRVPVTLDHIHQIFKPYGEVWKIITFHKNGVFKALVQLNSVEAASQARMLLEGKDIFQGCCHLRIGFSTLPDLHVKTPGNNARDFTSPSGATITGPYGAPQQGGEGAFGGQFQQQQQPPSGLIAGQQATPSAAAAYHGGSNGSYADSSYQQHGGAPPASHVQSHHPSSHSAPSHPHAPGCVVLVSNLPESRVTCDVLFTLFGVYGDVQRVKILYNKRDTALVQYVAPQSAYLAALHLNHLHLYGKQISVTPSKHVEVSLPKAIGAGGTQADQDQQQSGLTQDYTHSPIHRFKRTAGAASATGVGGGLGIHAKSIHPPSQVLHVSSLADAVTEDELRALFSTLTVPVTTPPASSANGESATGASEVHEQKVAQTPPVVQFFTSTPRPVPGAMGQPVPQKASKQAFLRFESVAAAVENLIQFHNYNLHGRYLRCSFSGKDPNQVHETNNGVPIGNGASTQQQVGSLAGNDDAASAATTNGGATIASLSGSSTTGGVEGQSTTPNNAQQQSAQE